MPLDHRLDQRQAPTGAFEYTDHAGSNLAEGFESQGDVRIGYADPGVDDGDLEAAPVVALREDFTVPPRGVNLTAFDNKLPSICLTLTLLALRSEEHTSELQSQAYLVLRLLLENKK